MSNVLAALAVLQESIAVANSVSGLIRQAQEEGRDLTQDELQAVKSRRDAAQKSFDEELRRRLEAEGRVDFDDPSS